MRICVNLNISFIGLGDTSQPAPVVHTGTAGWQVSPKPMNEIFKSSQIFTPYELISPRNRTSLTVG